MKKVFLSLCAASMLATVANAQLTYAPEAGFNFGNLILTETNNGASATVVTSTRYGIRLGAIGEYSFNDNFYLQPGIFFAENGAHGSNNSTVIKLNGLQIPVNVVYKFGKPGGNRFFIGAGLALTYYISGSTSDGSNSADIKFGSGADQTKPMDLGFGLHVGYQLEKGYYVRFGYIRGFSNLNNSDGATLNTYAETLTVGYFLGNKNGGGKAAPKKKK